MTADELAEKSINRAALIRSTPAHILELIPKYARAVALMREYGFDPNEVLEKMIAKLEQRLEEKRANER